MKTDYVPLSNSFMLVSLIGGIIAGWYTLDGTIPLEWGFTMVFMAIIFVVASLVSVRPGEDLQ
jgi:hypothetical protein